jgi:hypothetical protein
MRTYNLFQRKGVADLFWAVPQDVPVPNFVTADEWEYARPLDAETLSAFDATAAETSAAANGFYLFHSAS